MKTMTRVMRNGADRDIYRDDQEHGLRGVSVCLSLADEQREEHT